mgnify:CR=1 FL=1
MLCCSYGIQYNPSVNSISYYQWHYYNHYCRDSFFQNVLKKGIKESNPAVIAENFDEANFLFGIKGQTAETMQKDIELGLKYFERICVNIMCDNTTEVEPDKAVIKEFMQKVYPVYKDNPRTDILINNTDFGVGD